jgi:hypothetical protein
MRKFWKDLKRTLCLYLVVLAPTLIICSIVALIFGEEAGNKTAIACGALGGLWIVYYEWQHDVWGKRK